MSAPRNPPRKKWTPPARRKKRRIDERGVALILVLGAITVLTVFLTELQEETSSELASAIADRDALKAEYFARSAVNLARLLIATEPEVRKTITPIFQLMGQKPPQIPVWEFIDLILGPFNDSSSAEGFNAAIGGDTTTAKNLGLTGGRFELAIVDEDAKINLNMAARNEPITRDRLGEQLLGLMAPISYNPLFEARDGDNQFSDRQTICGALVDWADSDVNGNEPAYACDPRSSQATNSGQEDNFYQNIGMTYVRKNAAYDSLDEVRLVRGMGDDFWATFVDPEPENPKKRILTVWGQGAVNVNSANAQTLLAIVCGSAPDAELCNDPLQMEAFIMGVTLGKSMTFGLPLFGSTQGFVDAMKGTGTIGTVLASLQVKPVNFKNPKDVKKSIAVNSKMFSIYADGIVPGYKRTTKVRIHAVVDFRNAGQLQSTGMVLNGSQTVTSPTNALTARSGTSATGAGAGASAANSGSPMTADQLLQAMNSNPAGTVVYWRIE